VVTSALGPADALPFVDAGFAVREQLHLLAAACTTPRPARPAPGPADAPGRGGRPAGGAGLDSRSFDDFWALDRQVSTTPPRHRPERFRVGAEGGRAVAYAITGRR